MKRGIVTNCYTGISPVSSLHSTSLLLRNPHFLTTIYLPFPNFTSLHFLMIPPNFHFTRFVTVLTLFLKLLGLQKRVPKAASARSWFPSCMANLQSNICFVIVQRCGSTPYSSVTSVRKRTIPTERPPLVSEVSANFLRIEGATWSA
jgi:hypothetical protein